MADQPIEYGGPTSRSFEGMKRVLFQPFDLGKWFALGFTAFLAGLLDGGGGGGGSAQYQQDGSNRSLEIDGFFRGVGEWIEDNLPLFIGLSILVVSIGIAIFVVFTWLSSRGKFMFLDNVVHNRAEIGRPWTQFRREGNSLFVWRVCFSVIVFVVFLLVGGTTAGLVLLTAESGAVLFPIIFGGLLLFALALAVAYIGVLLENFVVPLMYRNSITTTEAWRRFLVLHRAELGSFVLFALWVFLLSILVVICIIVFGIATCCIGFLVLAIPYIGTVLILPVHVFFRFLGPEFLRQFGSDYDILSASEVVQPA